MNQKDLIFKANDINIIGTFVKIIISNKNKIIEVSADYCIINANMENI